MDEGRLGAGGGVACARARVSRVRAAAEEFPFRFYTEFPVRTGPVRSTVRTRGVRETSVFYFSPVRQKRTAERRVSVEATVRAYTV